MSIFDGNAAQLERAAQTFLRPSTSLLDNVDPRLPEHVKERLPQAQAHALEAMAKAEATARKARPRHAAQFAALQRSARNAVHTLQALQELGDEVTAPIAKVSACKAGCTHCCHIPVAVSGPEAELIGKAIGLKPVSQEPEQAQAWPTWGYDQPCPFLQNNRCSIYAHRPMACRWHFNLDADALLCELIPEMTVPVPLADMRNFQLVYSKLAVGEPVADIRDFFPAERVARWKPAGHK